MKKIFIILFYFHSMLAFAQINYERGKITFPDGNSMNRTISYFSDRPTEIIIEDSLGRTGMLSSVQISEMSLVDGRKFVSKSFGKEQDSIRLILQSLIESPEISLFSVDESGTTIFYVSKNNVLYKLEKNERIIKNESGTFKNYDNKYIGTLKALMADRPDIANQLDKIQLNETGMVDVISRYDKGNVTYFWQKNSKIRKIPYWVLLGQYCNYGSYLYGERTVAYSYGLKTGLQYYFSKGSRHSFRFTADYSKYNLKNTSNTIFDRVDVYNTISLGCSYEYDFVKTSAYSVFLLMHLADISYYSVLYHGDDTSEKGVFLFPRISPGIGAEIKPFSRLGFYGEINNILNLEMFPYSFSIGVKYDLKIPVGK